MAAKGSEMALALVIVLMTTWHGAWAQAGCSNALMSLAPCLNFVTGNLTSPSSACCSNLTGVVKTQPQCLCTMINGGGPMAGFAVNQTLAMALPAACNVQTPPVSQCNAASGPATSPANAPVGSPSSDSTPSDSSSNDTPIAPKTPSTSSQTNTPSSTGTGSKSTPSTTSASSGAMSTTSSLPAVMLLSLVVSFALKATKF